MKALMNMTAVKQGALSALCTLSMGLLAGCSGNRDYETAICALVDVSGTYAEEKANVANLIKAGILPAMISGDSLFLITIDNNSFSEENLIHRLTLDYRPSYANQQKLDFAGALDEFARSPQQSSYTDISGAMMLCADYLKSTGAGTQMMLIFSDMEEDLQQGVIRNFEQNEFADINIAGMNVIKLTQDSNNPQVYRGRLRYWEERITGAGAAGWHVILEPSQIPEFIREIKEVN